MPRNTGFNDPAENRRLAGAIALNHKTYKCIRCKKAKPLDQFSNKQQGDMRRMILQDKRNEDRSQNEGVISCRNCTSGQVTELFCMNCETNKSLDEFAKTHRRNRDHARCKKCMEKILKTQPDEPVLEGGSDDDSSASNPHEDWDDDTTSSVTGTELQTAYTIEGSQWVQQAGPSFASSTGAGFDLSAYGGSGRRGNSGAQSSYGSSRAKQAEVKSSKTGWAKKIPSGKKSVADDIPPSDSSDEDDGWNKGPKDDDSDDSGP